jgi:alpha-tubulin suppressor-like RCC1 family protein
MSISDVAAIAGGEYHTIAAKSDGTVWTWGSNDNGQLGIGPSPPQSDDAVQVTGLSGVVAVAAGSYHSVILGSDGTVWTWGQNFDGQLGDGGTTQRNAPFQVPGLINIDKIAAGQSHTAAVKSP